MKNQKTASQLREEKAVQEQKSNSFATNSSSWKIAFLTMKPVTGGNGPIASSPVVQR